MTSRQKTPWFLQSSSQASSNLWRPVRPSTLDWAKLETTRGRVHIRFISPPLQPPCLLSLQSGVGIQN